MNCRLLFGAALAVFTGAALAACGGSSSETPPPLQPDPAGFRYAPTFSRPVVEESDAGDAPLSAIPAKPGATAGLNSGLRKEAVLAAWRGCTKYQIKPPASVAAPTPVTTPPQILRVRALFAASLLAAALAPFPQSRLGHISS